MVILSALSKGFYKPLKQTNFSLDMVFHIWHFVGLDDTVETANTNEEEDSGEVGDPEEPMIHPCPGEAVGESQTVVTALNDDVTE